MHAKESRFNFETRTPTGYGELKTFLEVDFFGNELANIAGSTNGLAANPLYPRLRHAYGTLGPLLIGQSFSLFSDIDAIGETIEGGGPTGYMSATSGNRTPQVRYTYAGPSGISAAVSAEQPLTRWISAGANALGSGNSLQGINASIGTQTAGGATANEFAGNTNATNKMPNFIVAARWDQAWGHVMVKGFTADNRIFAAAPTGVNIDKRAYGGSVSGHLNTFGKDVLRANAQWGRGMGIFNYGSEAESILWNGSATAPLLALPASIGGLVSYQHWFTDELRANIVEGYDWIGHDGRSFFTLAQQSGLERRHWTNHVNLIWSPVPQVDLGIEYAFLHRQTQSGQSGSENRLQVAGKFKF
jgi:Porin subfamily